jgi:UDP-glucose 4-epimerase
MTRDTIVVTGASGFVGRRLVPLLAPRGLRIVAALREPERAPAAVRQSAQEIVSWDLARGRLPAQLLERTCSVLHLAAHLPSNYLDADQARPCLEYNALGTLELVRGLVEAEVPQLVLVSTGNTYRDTTVSANEESAAFPSRQAPYYLSSKLCAEIFAEHLAQRAKLRLVTLRPSAVYGPGMKGGMVHLFATRLLAGQPITVQDGGRYSSDLVYVDDVARAIVASLEPGVSGCFNLGAGRSVTTAEVAEGLGNLIEGARELVRIEPATTGPAAGFAALDITRARERLGHRPTRLDDGLAAYVAWLRQ